MKLFSNINVVHGFNRSLIIDFQRNEINLINNNFFRKISKETINLADLKNDEIHFLNKNELLLDLNTYSSSLFKFTNLSYKFENQYFIDTLFIKIKNDCDYIDLIWKNIFSRTKINRLKIFDYSDNIETVKSNYKKMITSNLNEYIYVTKFKINDEVYLFKEYLSKYRNNKPKISLNFKLFLESNHQNNFFYRRLFIDTNGDVFLNEKTEDFISHISKFQFQSFLKSKEFSKFRKYTKDSGLICRDCELRYICVDTRVPLEVNDKKNWFTKVECEYNPYISKWKDEDGYKTLAECGVISNENGFSIDHDKIAEINKELWGE